MPNRKRRDDFQVSEQPRHPGVRFSGQPVAAPAAPSKKLFRDMTPIEKWHDRRDRLFRVLPTRLTILDTAFHNFLKVADRERYEITDAEVDLIIAHINEWAEAVEESFRSRQERQPGTLPPVTLDHDLTPPTTLLRIPPPGFEEFW